MQQVFGEALGRCFTVFTLSPKQCLDCSALCADEGTHKTNSYNEDELGLGPSRTNPKSCSKLKTDRRASLPCWLRVRQFN